MSGSFDADSFDLESFDVNSFDFGDELEKPALRGRKRKNKLLMRVLLEDEELLALLTGVNR